MKTHLRRLSPQSNLMISSHASSIKLRHRHTFLILPLRLKVRVLDQMLSQLCLRGTKCNSKGARGSTRLIKSIRETTRSQETSKKVLINNFRVAKLIDRLNMGLRDNRIIRLTSKGKRIMTEDLTMKRDTLIDTNHLETKFKVISNLIRIAPESSAEEVARILIKVKESKRDTRMKDSIKEEDPVKTFEMRQQVSRLAEDMRELKTQDKIMIITEQEIKEETNYTIKIGE